MANDPFLPVNAQNCIFLGFYLIKFLHLILHKRARLIEYKLRISINYHTASEDLVANVSCMARVWIAPLTLSDSYTTYDQRQDGPWNLEIDVKNVKILAFTKGNKEDYVDYDYAYDYSEMTIKPPNGTKPNTTLSVISSANTTDTVSTTDSSEDKTNNTFVDADVVTTTLSPPYDNFTTDFTTNTALVINSTTAKITAMTICKKGFMRNSNGHCELPLQSTSNALRKLVKLSQKLKRRRGNRNNDGSM